MLTMDEAGKQRISALLGQAAGAASAHLAEVGSDSSSAADQLFAVLAARVQEHATDPALTNTFAGRDVALGFSDALAKFGQCYFNHVQQALHQLLCGGDAASKGIRDQISSAFHLGRDAVATTIASGIATFLGIAPAIASVLGVIIVVLFFRPGLEAMCEVWKMPSPVAGA